MKLIGIYIFEYQQFKDFELNFVYPKHHVNAGKPLEKICFIGRNGTGKSTLLNIIQSNISNLISNNPLLEIVFKINIEEHNYYVVKTSKGHSFLFTEEIDTIPNWRKLFFNDYGNKALTFVSSNEQFWISDITKVFPDGIHFNSNAGDLLIYAPSDRNGNVYAQMSDVPATSLNESLKLFKSFPYFHLISPESVKNFWEILTYQVKKRESDLLEFQSTDENLDKTVREVQEIFESENPRILDQIAIIWDKILNKANLEFDSKNASTPVQLNDNLKAYIKLKTNNNRIGYNQLSSGIRNFIFRLGHIYSLYFNRDINNGFLLIDEPENDLYPDFLYDLIETYLNIIKGTQFFIATHSPIIAAQFEPFERIILEFNDDGTVYSRSGETPVGDDPNDMLTKDFNVRSLLGKEGVKKWERYIELKLTIPTIEDKSEKSKLLDEFMEIGNTYNFSDNEVF